MERTYVDEAIALMEKSNANLQSDLMTAEDRRAAHEKHAYLRKLVEFAETVLAPDDPEEVAKVTGTSVGKAKQTVETAKALRSSDEVSAAFSAGDISFDQATEIARAEVASPGSSAELLDTAATESFQVLRDKARKIVLEAEQKRGLAERQREARSARSHVDELGMVTINLKLEPHVGTPIVNRAEAEAGRLFRAAKKDGTQEPFERHLADAYAAVFSGSPVKCHSRKSDVVVVVSHEVTQRGWTDVRDGEVCKIPGVGPVAPEVARQIAEDAFLTGVLYDGRDLTKIKRWTRSIPVEVQIALELGDPPGFDWMRCVDCGNHFGNQRDHLEPHCRGGTASTDNLKPRCYACHQTKTARDRKAGKLTPASRKKKMRVQRLR